ncbi:MAG: hypothetical protein ACKN81_02985, partial [Pirellulaceae bacterium]
MASKTVHAPKGKAATTVGFGFLPLRAMETVGRLYRNAAPPVRSAPPPSPSSSSASLLRLGACETGGTNPKNEFGLLDFPGRGGGMGADECWQLTLG